MRTLTKASGLGIGLLFYLTVASAQSPTGRWVVKVSPDDEVREIVVALNAANDGRLTGYVLAPKYQDRIVEGRVEGRVFWFLADREFNNNTTPQPVGLYAGEVQGDKLKLAMPSAAAAVVQVTPVTAGMPARPGGSANRVQRMEFTRASTEAATPLAPRPPRATLTAPAPVPGNGLAKTPPMGWSSWNKFQSRANDKVVREIADAMVRNGMKDAGYVYLNIDDGWEGTRDADGSIRSNSKFPNMKALAGYVHSRGLKLGIYSSPGPKTCAGYEGSYQHEEQDARTYAAWGIDYLKYDWCSASRSYTSDRTTDEGVYAKMGAALLAAGRPIVYSLCQYGKHDVGEWGAKVGGNLWRTTGDIGDRWESLERIGFVLQPGREKYAGPGRWNDPDMLEIGNGGMSDVEYRTHMSLWSLLAAPLLAGNDLRDVPPAILEILTNREVIAVDQDALGIQATRVARDGDLEVWWRLLSDGSHAVGLFNRGGEAAKVTAKWSDGRISGSHEVRDLWKHEDLGRMANAYSAEVPPHGVVLIRIAP
jgi:alpha-galactosidase